MRMSRPNQELRKFQDALKSVLSVSKSEMKEMLAQEKIANVGKPKRGPKPKTSASSHEAS